MHRLLLTLPLLTLLASAAEPAKPAELKKEKPFTPGGIYRQGDMQRPRPTVITPPTATTAPSDAVVLFGGKDLSKFIRKPRKDDKDQSDVPNWKIENGYAEITPKGGDIDTRDKFGSCQIHLEWATPAEVVGKSQGRGNSGVLIHGWGEVQVLDSYENDTYPDGQAGAIYSNYPPLVNASRKPGEWQSYDIICECAQFDEKGNVLQPARITVLLNGVIVQHAAPLETKLQEVGFALQDHHNPTRYRNIWVRPLHRYDENAKKNDAAK
ncbi:DUF1080 domain-containing protein [Prosthecobacter sp.]|uniref:3-keto-disaccharide hydrolase n=1 Tax=Prosthecobacter sp. TaxID=1965333 RepID=UPI00248A8448|nr:DUF1080 domain-containing protein [Prosthecobacter sp.]MDI1313866.1 DUF1080 domain-containing protein [Prosthecobacter sp.]